MLAYIIGKKTLKFGILSIKWPFGTFDPKWGLKLREINSTLLLELKDAFFEVQMK